MKKPAAEWTEDDVLSLPTGENDGFERKGAEKLDLTLTTVKEPEVLNELAKQLSAFANTGGGQIVYGVNDSGTVDKGGVSRCVKGRRSTKEWLEDLIPTLTDYEVVGCNVYEIGPKPINPAIAIDKSLYLVDIPDSERAPHQSVRDLKYYVRLGGSSQPARHRLIEDIRNRVRHPKIEVQDFRTSGVSYTWTSMSAPTHLNLPLQFNVVNNGVVRASNCCLLLGANVFLRQNTVAATGFSWRPAVTPGTMLMELQHPLYPGMATRIGTLVTVGAQINVGADPDQPSMTIGVRKLEDVTFSVTIYADSAPPQTQQFQLTDVLGEGELERVINQERIRLRR